MSLEPARFLGTVWQGLHGVDCPAQRFPSTVKMPVDAGGKACAEEQAAAYMIYHYRNISGQYCYVTGGDTTRTR